MKRRRGVRAARRKKRTVIAGLIVAAATAALTGIIGNSAWKIVDNSWGEFRKQTDSAASDSSILGEPTSTADPDDTINDETTSNFPGTISVIYGSVNNTAAVFPDGLPGEFPETSYAAEQQWVVENGGVLANDTAVGVSFNAPTNVPVYIEDIRVRRVVCDPALQGLYKAPLGAGDTFGRVLSYQLDDVQGASRELFDGVGGGEWRFPLWVDSTESEVIAVVLTAYSGSYQVVLDVDYSHDGTRETITLETTDDGQPLTITGRANTNQVLLLSPFRSDLDEYTVLSRSETDELAPSLPEVAGLGAVQNPWYLDTAVPPAYEC